MSLLDKASLIVTPNAYKTSKLYSVVPNTTLGDIDVVRATTATRINASGLIESVGVNIPRIDYTNGSCPSLLVEPQRTNLTVYSEQFNNLAWEKGTTITLVNNTTETTSPFGINNATKATANGTGLIHIRQTTYSGTTSPTTSSIFVKKANNRYVGFRNGGSGTLHDVFDFNTETWTNNSGSTLSFDKLINGWYRLKSSRTNTLANTYLSIIIPNNTSGNETATVSNLTLYIFGAQAELNVLYATSYIPTVASTVTRNADVISKTGISSLIGQIEGTVFLEINLPNPKSTGGRTLLQIGLSPNRIYFAKNSDTENIFQLATQSANGYNFINTSNQTSAILKMAIAYKNGNNAFYLNGSLISVESAKTNPISLSQLIIGEELYGNTDTKVNSVQFYKTRLSNTELAQLTTL